MALVAELCMHGGERGIAFGDEAAMGTVPAS
jgi:hypothetical protein